MKHVSDQPQSTPSTVEKPKYMPLVEKDTSRYFIVLSNIAQKINVERDETVLSRKHRAWQVSYRGKTEGLATKIHLGGKPFQILL